MTTSFNASLNIMTKKTQELLPPLKHANTKAPKITPPLPQSPNELAATFSPRKAPASFSSLRFFLHTPCLIPAPKFPPQEQKHNVHHGHRNKKAFGPFIATPSTHHKSSPPPVFQRLNICLTSSVKHLSFHFTACFHTPPSSLLVCPQNTKNCSLPL